MSVLSKTQTSRPIKVEAVLLADDGLVPNNSRLPLLIYRDALAVDGKDPEHEILERFAEHGWGGGWVDGIFPYHHYHPASHEVLGIAKGHAKVQFGGAQGPVLEIAAGDVVLIPAGVGHRRVASAELSVVGAYPKGQEDPAILRAEPAQREDALASIRSVPVPDRDPVTGAAAPLREHWP